MEGLGLLVDQALAHDHACRFAEVGSDPATAEFFCDGGSGAGTTVEVGDDAPCSGRGANYSLYELHRLLSVVPKPLFRRCLYAKTKDVRPKVINRYTCLV